MKQIASQSNPKDDMSASGKQVDKLVFECVRCGSPIVMEGLYAKMMQFFNMPKKSGLCYKCVTEGNDMVDSSPDKHTEDT